MNTTLVLLAVVYTAVLALLVLVLFQTALAWRLKAAAVALALALSITHYQALKGVWGWPVDERPPDGAEMVGTLAREPNRRTGSEGAVYLWAIPPGHVEPRAYRLPYEPETHGTVARAEERASEGHRQVIRRVETSPDTDSGTLTGGIRVEDAPPPALPPK
ncbi:MAG: hypothetical protein ACPGUC_04600 [Gammaproteobacteria bacterium]